MRPRSEYPTAIIQCPDCGIDCNFVANSFAEMPFSYPGTYHPHQKGSRECLERQVTNLKAEVKAAAKPTLEEMYHAGWAVIIYRAKQAAGVSETELSALRRLRSALEPIQTSVRICNPYDAILDDLDWSPVADTACKYLVCLRLADNRAAVVIDHNPKEAIQRAFMCDPDGGWEHASVAIITRVRSTRTPRVLALESLNEAAG